MPGFLVDALAAHIGHTGQATPVFTAPGGGQLRHGNFYNRIFKPTVQKTLPAELRRTRFHDLRHTHAALLIAQGAHPKAIQYRLNGHYHVGIPPSGALDLLSALTLQKVLRDLAGTEVETFTYHGVICGSARRP